MSLDLAERPSITETSLLPEEKLQASEAKTVVVAMSGGVDSSTVAALLHSQGYNVIGITLQLYDYGEITTKKGACCAGQDIYDAKIVADRLNIPHYVLDYESKFKNSVIDDFTNSYMHGETPLPCVRCNQSVKFKDLLKMAKEIGAESLVTGHYVRKIHTDEGPQLHMGIDPNKDQSYFLFATTQEQLNYLEFPLGSLNKEQTRQLAKNFGLEIADKPDSQDICFVPNGNYRDVISKMRPDAKAPGKMLHIDGYEVGTHQGIINYTVGQRRGIGIGGNSAPLYVIKIDPQNNAVYVGPKSALQKQEFLIKEVNWLANDLNPQNLAVEVKIRSTMRAVNATIYMQEDGFMNVILDEAEDSITPGQACVIYRGSRLLGGGWITRNIK